MNPKKNNTVVLAFSGGLDTTYCLAYLSAIHNKDVHCLMLDTGGFDDEEIAIAEERAYKAGAATFKCIDLKEEMYERVLKYLIFGNVLKNGTYPLSVSAERVSQALSIASYASTLHADAVAHGSTGAGNDQIRFDLIFGILIPEIEIITPVRDQKLTREQEIDFLKKQGIELDFIKSTYSINKGIWGTSVGGKETLTSSEPLPENAWPHPVERLNPEKLELYFEKGEIRSINTIQFDHPVNAIKYLNEIAAPFGIGRDIHTGDTIVGIKGRVGIQASAAVLLIKAHHALEKHILSKWQLYWKEQLGTWYGQLLHEGQYLDPVMRNIEAFFTSSQENVTGTVFLTLHPYRFTIDGIESEFDLMNPEDGVYGEINKRWSADEVKGFTKIMSNQASIWQRVNNKRNTADVNLNH